MTADPAITLTPDRPRVATPIDVLIARVDRSAIYPPLWMRYLTTIDTLRNQGRDYYAVSGYRSFAEQTALYLQGRNLPGPIVTNARGGRSAHNFGLAIDSTFDVARDRKGLQPGWAIEDYARLGEVAKANTLDAGAYWQMKDGPHVQLDLESKGVSLPMLLAEYRKPAQVSAKIQRVWDFLNDRGPW